MKEFDERVWWRYDGKITFKDNKNSDKCVWEILIAIVEHFYVLYFFIEEIKTNVIFWFLYTDNANYIINFYFIEKTEISRHYI